MADRKLLLGPKVRRLRRDQRLTQAQMAADLEISPAYLNLIEHNQRPVSAQVLVKIAAAYDIDLGSFARDDAPERAAQLRTLFADPALGDLRLSAQDFADMTALSPEASAAILALGERVARQRQLIQAQDREGDEAADLARATDPAQAARSFFQDHKNHFPALEDLTDQMRQDWDIRPQDRGEAVVARVLPHAPFSVQVMPTHVMGTTLRRHDTHGRRLLLNQALAPASRRLQTLTQFFLTAQRRDLDRLMHDQDWPHPAAAKMARVSLAAYAAAALLMPYGAVRAAAQEAAYDIDALAHDFAVTREQMAQRLTTLQRPGQRGLALFMARIDAAGNMTKRLSAANFPLIRSGAACPRWHVHRVQGQAISAELVELPDGAKFLSLAIPCRKPTLSHAHPGQPYVLVLGCAASDARKTVYGAGLDLDTAPATPIGPACRLCERLPCTYRAAAPANHEILIDEGRQDMAPFSFV